MALSHAPQKKYKGVGVFSVEISKDDTILSIISYSGEKPPHMWWSEFDLQIMFAFNAYGKN